MASFTSLLTGTPIPTPLFTKPTTSSLSLRPKPITIQCSSRPKKKATAHHAKTRPKKHALWDKKRGPTVYPPLPPFPPEWTLLESGSASAATEVAVAEEPTAE